MKKTILSLLVAVGLIASASASVLTGDLTSGLVAYYPLNSNSINQVDPNEILFENNINYQITGGQMSASFNGQDSYLKSTDNLSITGTQSRTFSAWIYTANPTAGCIAKWGLLDRYGNIQPENADFGQLWSLYVNFFDKNAFVNADYRIYAPTNTGSVNLLLNQWNHIAFCYEQSSDQLTIYVNNNPIVCETQALDPFYASLNTALGSLYLGAQSPNAGIDDGWFNKWSGSMANVLIYDRALTSSQVSQLYSLQSVPEPSTYALFGLGAIGLLMVMRRKKTA